MFDKASLKLGLDKAVLQSMSGREGSIAGIQQFSKKEIEDLLRKGAYAAIMEEDDEGSKFCEEDIDQILLRRTTTITIESEGKGSTFAKVPPVPLRRSFLQIPPTPWLPPTPPSGESAGAPPSPWSSSTSPLTCGACLTCIPVGGTDRHTQRSACGWGMEARRVTWDG
uniref:Uncharacterized protein n=1 Tax=Terrapene triunguis TaxID=2587831 RepID=A0A674JAL8_9SAUR